MSISVTVGNYKGGVGKSKNSVLIAYSLAKKGHKVLVIDLDPQANATTVLLRTKQIYDASAFSFKNTLMNAIIHEDLSNLEVEIMDNLFLLPSHIDFANYPRYLDYKFGMGDFYTGYDDSTFEKIIYMNKILSPIKEKYDYVLIDVPPTKSYITDSAVVMSDYILLILQTQELSLDGANSYIDDLRNMAKVYDEKGVTFDICGILPVLMDNHKLDKFILKEASDIFGEENIFNIYVPQMARLKRFDNTGITDHDMHDRRVHHLYENISEELIQRINFFEKEDI